MHSVERLDEEALTEHLQSSGCRRGAIGRSMDGIDGVDCKTLDAIYCDRCARGVMVVVREVYQSQAIPVDPTDSLEGLVAIETRTREIGQYDEEVMEGLRRLGRRCIYCEMLQVTSREGGNTHAYQECPVAVSDGLRCSYEDFQNWWSDLQLHDYMHCFQCGLPQTICKVAEFGGVCAYPDVMLPVLFVLHRHGKLVPTLHHQLGYDGQTEEDLME